MVIPYRHFGATYRNVGKDLNPLKMEPIGCPETSVRNNHCSLFNNQEERSSHVGSMLSNGSVPAY